MKKILILAAATAVAALFTGSPAFAQEPAAASQLIVSYADLDLSTDHGVRTLDRRLRSAAEAVCGPISSADPRGKNEVRHCRTQTLAEARAERDNAIAYAGNGQIQLASQR